jgi:hypothetical protein
MNENKSIKNFQNHSPYEIPPSFPVCPQCGMMHPPLKPGEKCPNSKEKTKDGNIIPFDDLFSKIKTICISQIQNKKIKNINKLFAEVIVILTKEIEKYKE